MLRIFRFCLFENLLNRLRFHVFSLEVSHAKYHEFNRQFISQTNLCIPISRFRILGKNFRLGTYLKHYLRYILVFEDRKVNEDVNKR